MRSQRHEKQRLCAPILNDILEVSVVSVAFCERFLIHQRESKSEPADITCGLGTFEPYELFTRQCGRAARILVSTGVHGDSLEGLDSFDPR